MLDFASFLLLRLFQLVQIRQFFLALPDSGEFRQFPPDFYVFRWFLKAAEAAEPALLVLYRQVLRNT